MQQGWTQYPPPNQGYQADPYYNHQSYGAPQTSYAQYGAPSGGQMPSNGGYQGASYPSHAQYGAPTSGQMPMHGGYSAAPPVSNGQYGAPSNGQYGAPSNGQMQMSGGYSGAPPISNVQYSAPASVQMQTYGGYSGPPMGQAPPYQNQNGYQHRDNHSPYPQYSAPAPQATVPPALPNMQQPTPAPFHPSGRKRALLIGVNYIRGGATPLHGCINDALCLRHLLKSRFGFQDQDITVLTDDQHDSQRVPTRANILYQMQQLVWDLRSGDSLFMSFSGHGSQVPDLTGDEKDGKNEVICPSDCDVAGDIVDDEINRLVVNPLPPGVRLHVVIDACHSGTAMDLEFRAKFKPGKGPYWKQEYIWRPTVYKGTQGGECIQFGAARDNQLATDTNQLSGSVSTGAATFGFIQAIERNVTGISYGKLLEAMWHTIASLDDGQSQGGQSNGGQSQGGAIDDGFIPGQIPCICANSAFDFNRPFAI